MACVAKTAFHVGYRKHSICLDLPIGPLITHLHPERAPWPSLRAGLEEDSPRRVLHCAKLLLDRGRLLNQLRSW